MHQAHNIRWSTITRHLKVEQPDPNSHNAVSTSTKGLSTEYAEMNHFLRKFVSTIREFSATERVKYPATPAIVSKGKVFSDIILRRYASPTTNGVWGHESVSRDTQQIECWLRDIPRKQRVDPVGHRDAPKYATVVKVCLTENELAPLMMLAVHPRCDPKSLFPSPQGGYPGWGELAEVVLTLYIFINVVGNTPALLDDNKYTRMHYYSDILTRMLHRNDHDSVPHGCFWDSRTKPRSPKHGIREPIGNVKIVDFFQDSGELKEYLKLCWRVIYGSDMLMRECGIEPDWEKMIVRCMQGWGFEGKHQQVWFPDCGVWDAARGTYSGIWADADPIEFGSSKNETEAVDK